MIDLIKSMAVHAKENPTHGYNCACKDTFIRMARRRLSSLSEEEWQEARYLFHLLSKPQ